MCKNSDNSPIKQEGDATRETLQAILSLLQNSTDKAVIPDFLHNYQEFTEILEIIQETQNFSSALKLGQLNYSTRKKSYSIG